jgi:hypothetical protein
MKRPFNILLLAFAPITLLAQTYTVQFDAADLLAADSTVAPVGSSWVLVVDSLGDGFTTGWADADIFSGSTLSIGTSLGDSDNLVIAGGGLIDSGSGGGYANTVTPVSLSGNVGTGDLYALYWFPEVSGGTLGSLGEYGFFRTDTIDTGAGGAIAMELGNSGAALQTSVFDTNLGGVFSPAELTATAIVPEPAHIAALFGFLALGFALWRRR